MNYRLTISYDGTRYHGWESKKEVDTIEGKLEAVFARMTEQDVKIHGAGRTDAGVNAKGMVANGFLDTALTPEEIKAYANHYLPDIEAMQKAAGYLIGTHDFKSFCGNNKMKKSTVRTIYDITIAEEEGYLRMTFHGNGFLQNMVRILTGTLLEVGYGRKKAEDMEAILAACDRQMAGPTAPPHGLMLLEVEYGV